jgi:hypothetical protein
MAEDVDKNIPDNENVVRGICTPYHYNEKKDLLKRGAFRQKDPTRGISVYRTLILSPQNCKERAKGLSVGDKKYIGLARTSAGAVRSAEAEIADSREDMFYGHADVFIMRSVDGYVHEAGEPPPPEVSELVDRRIDIILAATVFFKDQQPDSEDWHGPDLAAA